MAKKKEEKRKRVVITQAQLDDLVDNWDNITSVKDWADKNGLPETQVASAIKKLREADMGFCPKKTSVKDQVAEFIRKKKKEEEK